MNTVLVRCSPAIVVVLMLISGCAESREERRAKERLSEANMKGLILLMQLDESYTKRMPDSLEQLRSIAKARDRAGSDADFDRMLTNPMTGQNPGYVYKKPPEGLTPAQKRKMGVLWELRDGQPDPNGAIGYADFEIERQQP